MPLINTNYISSQAARIKLLQVVIGLVTICWINRHYPFRGRHDNYYCIVSDISLAINSFLLLLNSINGSGTRTNLLERSYSIIGAAGYALVIAALVHDALFGNFKNGYLAVVPATAQCLLFTYDVKLQEGEYVERVKSHYFKLLEDQWAWSVKLGADLSEKK